MPESINDLTGKIEQWASAQGTPGPERIYTFEETASLKHVLQNAIYLLNYYDELAAKFGTPVEYHRGPDGRFYRRLGTEQKAVTASVNGEHS